MLKIKLCQFRCWENLTLEIPLRQITLIKGNSGVGKSTVLQAIVWCLYGNIKLITPNHLPKANTSVSIELPMNVFNVTDILSIVRQRGKGRLTLSHNKKFYEDKVAQSIVDELFGKHDIWAASCYIEQGCRNSFLSIPNTAKLEFLNSLAFHEDDPSLYIQPISNNVIEVNAVYNEKLPSFTNGLTNLELMMSQVDINKLLLPREFSEITEQVNKLILEKERLILRLSKRDVAINMVSTLTKQLQTIRDIGLPNLDKESLNFLQKHNITADDIGVQKLNSVLILLQQKEQMSLEITNIQRHLDSFGNITLLKDYTVEDHRNALSKEIIFQENSRIAQYCNIPYDKVIIEEKISKLKDMLDSQEKLRLKEEYRQISIAKVSLEQQKYIPIEILPLEIFSPDYSKYNTTTLTEELDSLLKQQWEEESHLEHLKKGIDILQCPECSASLRHQQNILIKVGEQPVNLDELKTAKDNISAIKDLVSLKKYNILVLQREEMEQKNKYFKAVQLEEERIASLKQKKYQQDFFEENRKQQLSIYIDKLSTIEHKLASIKETSNELLLTPDKISEIYTLLGKLRNIVFVDLPEVSSNKIQTWLNYQEILKQTKLINTKFLEHISKIPETFLNELFQNFKTKIGTISAYITSYKTAQQANSQNLNMRLSLQQQIDNLSLDIGDDPTFTIKEITDLIVTLQEKLILSTKIQQVVDFRKQLMLEREILVNLNKELSTSQLLKERALEAECRELQKVANGINKKIQSVCSTLFDKDIDIKLNLFKTLKTTGNTKPVANFSVSYQGGTFDNITRLSGGEGDRASFAFTLALNKLSSCPLLMLDESFASLDVQTKLMAIKTINKKYNDDKEHKKKTCIVIMHDGVEGVFDNCIDFDDGIGTKY